MIFLKAQTAACKDSKSCMLLASCNFATPAMKCRGNATSFFQNVLELIKDFKFCLFNNLAFLPGLFFFSDVWQPYI